jgi:hypothetical protein
VEIEMLKKQNTELKNELILMNPKKYYRLKKDVFSYSEQRLFWQLNQLFCNNRKQEKTPKELFVGRDLRVFSQIRMIDFVEPLKIKMSSNFGEYEAKKLIMNLHIDFLICEFIASKFQYSPIGAIELNGKSHEKPEQKYCDNVKKQILEGLNLPLIILTNQEPEQEHSKFLPILSDKLNKLFE